MEILQSIEVPTARLRHAVAFEVILWGGGGGGGRKTYPGPPVHSYPTVGRPSQIVLA